MNRQLTILGLFIVFTSCNSETETLSEPAVESIVLEENPIKNDSEEETIFSSKIRENEKLAVGNIYIDTLTFLYNNSDADYYFIGFLTRKKDTVNIVTDDLLNEQYINRKMVVKWKIDSLYEAALGEELYFQEKLVSSEIIINDLEISFKKFLDDFVVDFVNFQSPLKQYLKEDIGFYSSYNTGLYCQLKKLDTVERKEWVKDFQPIAYMTKPVGAFCEGYPNVNDGFYFNRVLFQDLPEFDQLLEADFFIEEKFDLPAKYVSNELMKVTIIEENFHGAYLYFILIENKWYLFAADYCDCSA